MLISAIFVGPLSIFFHLGIYAPRMKFKVNKLIYMCTFLYFYQLETVVKFVASMILSRTRLNTCVPELLVSIFVI